MLIPPSAFKVFKIKKAEPSVACFKSRLPPSDRLQWQAQNGSRHDSVNLSPACSHCNWILAVFGFERTRAKSSIFSISLRTETLGEFKRYDNLYSWFQLGRWFWDHPSHSVSFSIFISVSYLFRLKGLTFRELMEKEIGLSPVFHPPWCKNKEKYPY